MPKKTVLITGSSKGLGRSLALTFAAYGYNIILHGRDKERLNFLKTEIIKNDVDCFIIAGDISKEKTINTLAACAAKTGIDILINNAGIYMQKLLEEISEAEIRQIIDVNLMAPVLLTKKIFEIFRKKRAGLIININSVVGKTFNMNESMYCASKHGLRGFMGSFQFEALKYDVSVVNVYSGAINTDMVKGRNNPQKLIKANEAAELVYSISQNYSSVRISEIDILRKIY